MPAKRKQRKTTTRKTPQIKVSIPANLNSDLAEAMEWDGATKASQFALSAIVQRIRRIKQQKAAELKQGA